MDNMLVDYYRDDNTYAEDQTRSALRAQGKLRYAIIDFDVSIMVPPETSQEEYTLPYYKAWIGTYSFQPYDDMQAEYQYKAFPFDVGCAGVVLCGVFQASII